MYRVRISKSVVVSPRRTRASVLLLSCVFSLGLAACGDDSPAEPEVDAGPDAPPDAPPPDGPMPPPTRDLIRIDYRTTRGTPYNGSTVEVPSAELFALSDTSFVTRSNCRDPEGCTYTWRDLAGAETLHRDKLVPVNSTVVSPDGKRAVMVALEQMEQCNDGELNQMVARGALQLLDLTTGGVGHEQTLRSNVWSVAAFSPSSEWYFSAPIAGNACLATLSNYRAVAAPNAPAPGIDPAAHLLRFIDPRRWLIFLGRQAGIADPLTAGSFSALAESPDRYEVTRGWVNVTYGFGELAQEVVSVPPSGPRKQTTLRDEDWFPFGSVGRWIRVCLFLDPAGHRDCRVVDAMAQVPARNFRVTITPEHPDDAVVLHAGAVVFVGPTTGGGLAVQRLDLASGRLEVLHAGAGELRMLGDGDAALLLQDGRAWFIEADREELLAESVNHVLTNFRLPNSNPSRQDELAVLALSRDNVRFTLQLLDVRSRRLATITDHLYFTPRRGLPFFLFDNCGQPWTTRHSGRVVEGLIQEPQHFYFVEEGTPATLWLVPLDLASPPRRLAQLAGNPASCHTPFSSSSGNRVGFSEDGAAGVTRVTTAPGR